jgi:1,4-alpha-glucan branching enzyme
MNTRYPWLFAFTLGIWLLLLTGCAPTKQPALPHEAGGQVCFAFTAPQARKVCVAGSFNQWSTRSHCMSRSTDHWRLCLPLPPGRYSYLMVIDEQSWQLDPGAVLWEDNGFGTKNSVLIVE